MKIDDVKNLNDRDMYKISKKLMSLYVTDLNKYLIQHRERYYIARTGDEWKSPINTLEIDGKGEMHTVRAEKTDIIAPLDKYIISHHLRGFKTIGVFADSDNTTKFITFDVDSSDINKSKATSKRLLNVLTTHFNIDSNDLHVSFSGEKGYHIDILLNERITTDQARHFYDLVMQHIPTTALVKIEFRPSHLMGVKLPLGIHRVTKRRCNFINKSTFEPLSDTDSLNYVLGIIPISPTDLMKIDVVFNWQQESNPDLKTLERIAPTGYAESILLDKQLKEKGTRHQATLALSMYFYIHEIELETAYDTILSILYNTPSHLFNEDSSPDLWERETERLLKLVYKGQYTLHNKPVFVSITKNDLYPILCLNTNTRKEIAFAALISNKRYADEEGFFYCTINTFCKLVDTKSRSLIQNTVKYLTEKGYLVHTNKKQIDTKRTALAGHTVYSKMVFQIVQQPFQQNDESKEILVPFSATFSDIKNAARKLFNEKELTQIIGRASYYKHWL